MTRSDQGSKEATTRARALMDDASPRVPAFHLVRTDYGPHLYLADRSRLFGLSDSAIAMLTQSFATADPATIEHSLGRLGLNQEPAIDDQPLRSPPLRAISLAIAQACNLGCSYCYADEGNFGGKPQMMRLQVALQAIDRLLDETPYGERASVAFLGGEPLAARAALRAATEHAEDKARTKGVTLNFSVTTNGTLITEEDGDFFERYGFAVTVSLDGIGAAHDQLRPFKSGSGSYGRIITNLTPLLRKQRCMQVSARVTVTPRNLKLRETLDKLIELGFHSVGFSPMLSSPSRREEMGASDLEVLLAAMIDCGQEFERQVCQGRRYPFANMANALRELHRGTHRPYPCGAGAGYLGVSAEGGLFACHRFVGDAERAMGDVQSGVDLMRQETWLNDRHVHQQQPCRSCWARYLCGGGCHHEVIHRGRPACDYIRGWLHYCLQTYVRLRAHSPAYFLDGDSLPLQQAQLSRETTSSR